MSAPRIAIRLTEHGEIAEIISDAPVDVFIVDDNFPEDRVYQWGSVITGVEHLRAEIGGEEIGHAHDGTFDDDGTGKRPPISARLEVVK